MFQIIGDIYDSTLSNFGGEMANGDMRPWHEEMLKSEWYRKEIDRDFATLVMTEDERLKAHHKGGPHLIDAFVTTFDSNRASITNTVDYADKHQFGEGVPMRPFYPVTEDGNDLQSFMVDRMREILNLHFT